jgi:putative transcriptional regulator
MTVKSRIKEIREELGMTQIELADQVGVSRQTIYFLEKGTYNPSLTVSFRISEVLKKPLNKIFYQVPIIKDFIEEQSLKDIKSLADKINRDYEVITHLSEKTDEELSSEFTKEELKIISQFLGEDFDTFFEFKI